MPKVNTQELEQLDDPIVLAHYLPSILHTLRAYESAIEKVREMEALFVHPGTDERFKEACASTDEVWLAKRDAILADLDKALKEIE